MKKILHMSVKRRIEVKLSCDVIFMFCLSNACKISKISIAEIKRDVARAYLSRIAVLGGDKY